MGFALRAVGGYHPQRHITVSFNCAEQSRYLKICLENDGCGDRLPSNHFQLLQIALGFSISNFISPFRSF